MKEIKDYLAYQGEQYRNPEKAGAEKDKMLDLRQKGQEARKGIYSPSKCFQARHSDWNLRPNQSMDESSAEITTTFLGLFTERGTYNRAHDGSSLYGNPNNWGISMEVSFIERKKDEATLSKQAKILDVPVVDGIYYWVQKNDEAIEYKLLRRIDNF